MNRLLRACSMAMLIGTALQAQDASRWRGLDVLVGDWTSEQGGGAPGTLATGDFSFSYDLYSRILVRRDHSEYTRPDRPPVRHYGLMVIYPAPPSGFRAVAFDSEGHVIDYDVVVADREIVFTSQAQAGSPRYRLT